MIFGGVIGYSGDDINKFLWMVRIAEGEHPQVNGAGDFDGTEAREMGGDPLDVQELEATVFQQCHQAAERELRGVRDAVEHRFPEEGRADPDPV